MTKAHDFLTLINEQQTTQANQIKQLLSSVTDDEVVDLCEKFFVFYEKISFFSLSTGGI